ncbi:MAG TPA: HPr family phosphocarrier protein [Anaerolineales bacterium]|nr:HPr family phosphocarrier protein [Anaerolineales bacterium]
MVEASVAVTHEVGLHARPAALFVQTANRFTSSVRVRNVTTGSEPVDAKSILGILTLGVLSGHEIQVSADGPDEGEALRALRALVEGGFIEGDAQA